MREKCRISLLGPEDKNEWFDNEYDDIMREKKMVTRKFLDIVCEDDYKTYKKIRESSTILISAEKIR